MVNGDKNLTLPEIEQQYPRQWVLVEETAWDKQGNPLRGAIRAHSVNRADLLAPIRKLHKRAPVKTFIFYTGDLVPANVTVVL
jgi:hypothetical protein